MTIFAEVTATYGEELAKESIAIIDWYVDILYPQVSRQPHEAMSRSKRMTFAGKLLECASATGIDLETIREILVSIARCTNQGEFDVTIYYATSPKVLGYWILQHPDLGFEFVSGTEYQPVDVYF